jgi:hypothetical protein
MFLRAGFNPRNHRTGIRAWTRPLAGGKFAPARLLRFLPGGDYAWHGLRHPRFLAWGEACVLGTVNQIDLDWKHQNGLAHSDLDTRREHKATKWSRD